MISDLKQLWTQLYEEGGARIFTPNPNGVQDAPADALTVVQPDGDFLQFVDEMRLEADPTILEVHRQDVDAWFADFQATTRAAVTGLKTAAGAVLVTSFAVSLAGAWVADQLVVKALFVAAMAGSKKLGSVAGVFLQRRLRARMGF